MAQSVPLTPRSSSMQTQQQKAFPVSWDQFHRDARALAWRLPAPGRSMPSSPSPAAGWSRRRSWRAN